MSMPGHNENVIKEIATGLWKGTVIPYLGPGVFGGNAPFPAAQRELAEYLSKKVTVPGRIRGNLTAVAQYIENFKHRKILVSLMKEAFASAFEATPAHLLLANLPSLPMIVHTWYDGTLARTFSGPSNNGRSVRQIYGVSRAEYPKEWFRTANLEASLESSAKQGTVLYQPYGSAFPEPNFLISDSDYVEVLTEIDIQTPIPPDVQSLRTNRHFLFIGCRFNQQLDRIFARQIMKRSSDRHWATLAEETTPKEKKFLATQNVEVINMNLEEFVKEVSRQISVLSMGKEEVLSCK